MNNQVSLKLDKSMSKIAILSLSTLMIICPALSHIAIVTCGVPPEFGYLWVAPDLDGDLSTPPTQEDWVKLEDIYDVYPCHWYWISLENVGHIIGDWIYIQVTLDENWHLIPIIELAGVKFSEPFPYHIPEDAEICLTHEVNYRSIDPNTPTYVAIDTSNLPAHLHVMPPPNQPPVAEAGPDQTLIIGETIIFDGSGSYDPDGLIVSYEWGFGDGATGSGMTFPHVYASDGLYVVTLTVTDDYEATDTDTLTVTVQTSSEATQDVITDVEDLDLPVGVEDSLISILEAAIISMNNNHENAATKQLYAFIRLVEAKIGKAITEEQADELIIEAQRIIDNI